MDGARDIPAPVRYGRREMLVGVAAVGSLAGCLGDVGGADTPFPRGRLPDEADQRIGVVSNAFEPNVATIEAGETVYWTLESGLHSVVLYHEANGTQHRVPEDIDPIDDELEDGYLLKTFDREGVYDYFCKFHHDIGMVGSLVVGTPNPDEPGLSEPADGLPQDEIRAMNDLVRVSFGIGGE